MTDTTLDGMPRTLVACAYGQGLAGPFDLVVLHGFGVPATVVPTDRVAVAGNLDDLSGSSRPCRAAGPMYDLDGLELLSLAVLRHVLDGNDRGRSNETPLCLSWAIPGSGARRGPGGCRPRSAAGRGRQPPGPRRAP